MFEIVIFPIYFYRYNCGPVSISLAYCKVFYLLSLIIVTINHSFKFMEKMSWFTACSFQIFLIQKWTSFARYFFLKLQPTDKHLDKSSKQKYPPEGKWKWTYTVSTVNIHQIFFRHFYIIFSLLQSTDIQVLILYYITDFFIVFMMSLCSFDMMFEETLQVLRLPCHQLHKLCIILYITDNIIQ